MRTPKGLSGGGGGGGPAPYEGPAQPTYTSSGGLGGFLTPPPPPDTPSLDLEQPGSSASVRGQHIPVGRGTRRVGGRPIDRVKATTANSDGSWPHTVAYSFGSRLDPTVAPQLVEILANGLTIWDQAQGAIEGVTVTFYNGGQTAADPVLAAYHTAALTPAYKDHIYAVIQFESLLPFGNMEPAIVGRLKDAGFTGESIPVADILESICSRCGLSTNTADPGHVDTVGFSSVTDVVHGVHVTGEVHPLDFLKNAGRLWQFDFYESGKGVILKKVAIPVTAPTLANVPLNDRLSVDDDGSTVTSKAASRHVARVVEVQYQDIAYQEQNSVQRARNEASDSSDIERWSVPFVMSASRALTQASTALQQAEVEGDEHKHMLPPFYAKYEPCDTAAFSVETKSYVSKIWTVTINSDLSVEFEYRNLNETRSDWEQETIDPRPVDTVDPDDLTIVPLPGALVLTGAAPTVTPPPSVPITPSTGSLVLTGAAPTIVTSGDSDYNSVVLLTYFDGTDGATSATEEKGKTLTFNGNAQLDTASSKFGTASLLLDGTGDTVTAADSDDWTMPGQFTIELWARPNSASATTRNVLSHSNATIGGSDWRLGYTWSSSTSKAFRFDYYPTGSTSGGTTLAQAGTNIDQSAFHHVAVTRDAADLMSLWVDGVLVDSATVAGSTNVSQALSIGGGHTGAQFLGWIDSVRITKGVCRYTAGFTPPVAEFPNSL